MLASALIALALAAPPTPSRYAWRAREAAVVADKAPDIASRFAPPEGFERVSVERGGFAEWLRGLPLGPGRGRVRLFNGGLKRNQRAHVAVVDIDVGTRDLQQCADAVIRLRAEYLLASGQDERTCFHLTDGSLASWPRWRDGWRLRLVGRSVAWAKSTSPDASRASFRAFLDAVFTYAGTISLARDLKPTSAARVAGGDVFVESGSPGHAVIVVDVATDPLGRRAVLLAQSYMPAQQIHLLDNPLHPGDPWYVLEEDEPLVTPEWRFARTAPRRFAESCR